MMRMQSRAAALFVLALGAPVAMSQRKALDGMAPDAEAILMPLPGDVDALERIELPGKGQVRALAANAEKIWLARDLLYVLSAKDRKQLLRRELPEGMLDLCADERSLYVLTSERIVVLDAESGSELRRIAWTFEADGPPNAIATRGDELLVSWPAAMIGVHKRIENTRIRTGPRRPAAPVHWLADDGKVVWAGCGLGLREVDVAELRPTGPQRTLPRPFGRGFGACVGGRLLLVERGTVGQRKVAAAMVDPARIGPEEHLTIGLRRGARGLSFEVGPKPISTPEKVTLELQRIARHPASLVPGENGTRKLMPVMLVVHPGVTVKELAGTWDLVVKAGFPEVGCRSYNSRLRPTVPEPPPPPPARKKRR